MAGGQSEPGSPRQVSRCIGLAIAQRFIVEGAEHVFINGRRKEMLDEAMKTIGSENVTTVQGDVSNMTDYQNRYVLIRNQVLL